MILSAIATPSARRRWRLWLRFAVLAAILAGIWHAFWWHHLKRLQTVHAGAAYRTAQPTELGLWYLARWHGVRTVINLRLEDPQLLGGIVDFNQPDGERESDYLRQLGVWHVSWPMGDEACWPWVSPWQFEEFFKLFDEPAHLPAAMHCVGGRHRTGTISALYRMEYDRWPAERALREMYSFSFGPPVPLQDHNLRTYSPRPRPNAAQLADITRHFASVLADSPTPEYEPLVHALRHSAHPGGGLSDTVRALLSEYLAASRPFALPLAQRLIDEPYDPLAELAAQQAADCLQQPQAAAIDYTAAAALVADFGTMEQQLRLLDILSGEDRDGPPTARYQAVAAGVTNRYTANRIAFLRPLLADERPRPEPQAAGLRYCDTAAARLSAIKNRNFLLPGWTWNEGVEHARAWFAEAPDRQHLCRLQPPTGRPSAVQTASPADADRVFRRR
ncbi:MAG: hypothetical protein AB7O62_10715 [Pirellulales bacterium]